MAGQYNYISCSRCYRVLKCVSAQNGKQGENKSLATENASAMAEHAKQGGQ